MRHGLNLDFPEFLKRIAQGEFFRGLTADYSRLLAPFAEIFGRNNIIVRRYRKSRKPERIVKDFLSPMLPGFRLLAGKYRANSFPENVTIPFVQVFQLYVANNLQPPNACQVDAAALARSVRGDRHHRYLSGPFDPVNLKDLLTQFWRVMGSNLRLLRKYRVMVPVVSGHALAKDVQALVGLDLDAHRRRNLIDRFRRTSPELRRVVNQFRAVGAAGQSSGDGNEETLANESSFANPELATKKGAPDSSSISLQSLTEELLRYQQKLRNAELQAAREIALRDRTIASMRAKIVRLRARPAKPISSVLRLWALLRYFLARQAWMLHATYAAIHQFGKGVRRRALGHVLMKSGLFDRRFYCAQKPELQKLGIGPLAHFLEYGCENDIDPHPLFDTSFYLEHNPDVIRAGVNPLLHFLKHGAQERRDPHPLFDTSYYLEQNPDVVRAGVNPLSHFAKCGAYEGRDPCLLFDISHYVGQNPELANSGVNPLVHFLAQGVKAHDPHPLFDCAYYLSKNPDVLAMNMNPLIHFIVHGASEGHNPHPLFDSSFYRQQNAKYEGRAFNPTVQFIATINPLSHYLQHGVHEGRDPHPLFDTSFYLKNNPDVARAGINPLIHFVQEGAFEGCDPSPSFRIAQYLKQNPELEGTRVNPLIHFVLRRKKQGTHS
ncbi:MAG TPA: hypothetical protein VF011_16225 [Terriglobales bacterium]